MKRGRWLRHQVRQAAQLRSGCPLCAWGAASRAARPAARGALSLRVLEVHLRGPPRSLAVRCLAAECSCVSQYYHLPQANKWSCHSKATGNLSLLPQWIFPYLRAPFHLVLSWVLSFPFTWVGNYCLLLATAVWLCGGMRKIKRQPRDTTKKYLNHQESVGKFICSFLNNHS